MTTWITEATTLTKDEIEWLVNVIKVHSICSDEPELQEVLTLSGQRFQFVTKPRLVYIETVSTKQDILIKLRFGDKFEAVNSDQNLLC
jgi:hypothetical protein